MTHLRYVISKKQYNISYATFVGFEAATTVVLPVDACFVVRPYRCQDKVTAHE